ncbi:hypothetical protein F2Q69_00039971 [Brassica cretica]|uniref:Uncharacterized protein n=1 Tax=Brassica cretica TaxID=69181 RepID=A0A8S9NF95_BRACR|nr:hypothetical protein F2Q69_00039971 [Brassica cretica]
MAIAMAKGIRVTAIQSKSYGRSVPCDCAECCGYSSSGSRERVVTHFSDRMPSSVSDEILLLPCECLIFLCHRYRSTHKH